MDIRKITASLSAVCILGSGIALNSEVCIQHSLIAKAAYFDSGEFGDGLRWELDDEGILKFGGSGEIIDWPWREYEPRIYSQCRIREVIIDKGITKVGFFDYSNYGLEKITILNPDCIICETPDNADPKDSGVISNVRFNGCIYGFSDSTAQTYAEKHGFAFEEIDAASVRKAGDSFQEDAEIVLATESSVSLTSSCFRNGLFPLLILNLQTGRRGISVMMMSLIFLTFVL